MRVYAKNDIGLFQCKEIVNDIKNKENIINEFGKERYISMYIAMCDAVRGSLGSNNYVSIGLPTSEEIEKFDLDAESSYFAIEFDYEVDKNNRKIYVVKWDNEKKMPYIEV